MPKGVSQSGGLQVGKTDLSVSRPVIGQLSSILVSYWLKLASISLITGHPQLHPTIACGEKSAYFGAFLHLP